MWLVLYKVPKASAPYPPSAWWAAFLAPMDLSTGQWRWLVGDACGSQALFWKSFAWFSSSADRCTLWVGRMPLPWVGGEEAGLVANGLSPDLSAGAWQSRCRPFGSGSFISDHHPHLWALPGMDSVGRGLQRGAWTVCSMIGWFSSCDTFPSWREPRGDLWPSRGGEVSFVSSFTPAAKELVWPRSGALSGWG